MVKEKLSDNGVFVANVVGSLSNKPESFLFSEIKTFKSVFPNSYFLAVVSPESTDPQNIIFVGHNSKDVADFNATKIWRVKNYF